MKSGVDNHIARSNYDFSVSYRFPNLDITDKEFYSQIANYKGEIIGTFNIIRAENVITLGLTKAQVNAIPVGEYIWDLKMVGGIENPLLIGKFTRTIGVTELP